MNKTLQWGNNGRGKLTKGKLTQKLKSAKKKYEKKQFFFFFFFFFFFGERKQCLQKEVYYTISRRWICIALRGNKRHRVKLDQTEA